MFVFFIAVGSRVTPCCKSLPPTRETGATLRYHLKIPPTRNRGDTEASRSWSMKNFRLVSLVGITSLALIHAGWAAGPSVGGGGGGGRGGGATEGGGAGSRGSG